MLLKVNTNSIDRDQLLHEFEETLNTIEEHGVLTVKAMFGFGIDMDDPDIWEEFEATVPEILAKLRTKVEDRSFPIGLADFHIDSDSFKLLLCNDSHMHLETRDKNIYEAIRGLWESNEILYTSDNITTNIENENWLRKFLRKILKL